MQKLGLKSRVDIMNLAVAECVRGGGAALMALHELAPARSVLTRTVTLVNGRIADAGPDTSDGTRRLPWNAERADGVA